MGKVTGFLELDREVESYRDVDIRINDYDEIFSGDHNLNQLQERCPEALRRKGDLHQSSWYRSLGE